MEVEGVLDNEKVLKGEVDCAFVDRDWQKVARGSDTSF